MKKLFIHQPLFRLLSPVISGVVVYLLLLLVNNNVAQLQEEFLSQELYVCIGLSYIIQELSRVLLILFKKLNNIKSTLILLLTQVLVAILLCICIVTVCITIYYKKILGFSPNMEELWLFNSIFCSMTLIYILLFISHQYLHTVNTKKLTKEQEYRQYIEEEFKEFKQGINPELLFESLENLLVLIQNDKDITDDFIDYLATIYRYILSSKEKQLVLAEEELNTVEVLVSLFNYLPYRNVKLINNLKSSFYVVPRSILFIVEQIIRTTIISSKLELEIVLNESKKEFMISYLTNDKLTTPFNEENLKEIKRVYSVYNENELIISTTDINRILTIPKLTTKTQKTI
ncbi:histidine kinase [Tenacibaculum sp. 190524A02b]|uniref:histidine kinase n=1 Tax=Tenacibaculum vairaonense TaxID=3137860 RepID=UPI0031FB7F9D